MNHFKIKNISSISVIVVLLSIILVSVEYLYWQNNINGQGTKNSPKSLYVDKEWEELLKYVYVPTKYSELCGFGKRNECPEFNFINGELPDKFKNKTGGSGEYANISLLSDRAVTGTVNLSNGKSVNVAAVPYEWCWASCGSGIYIIQKNKIAEVIAIVDLQKESPDKIEIKNNEILARVNNPRDPNEKPYAIECFFMNGILDNESFSCERISKN